MKNRYDLVKVLLLLASVLCNANPDASAQQLENHWWQPYGTVNTIVPDLTNNKLYLGGSFNYAGPPASERFSVLDSANCVPNATLPSPNGHVFYSLPDGNGGWYIAGGFTAVGGKARSTLAHIQSNGQPGPLFSNLDINGTVFQVATNGNTLYATGDFSSIRYRQPFNNITDGSVGNVLPNVPNANADVKSSTPDGSGGWYTAGAFTAFGNSKRSHLARIGASGQVQPFFDSMRIGYYNQTGGSPTVNATTVFNGQLYFGGDFTFIGRDQAFGGAVTASGAYNPAFEAPDGEVRVAIPDGNGGFYIGGDFKKVGSVPRQYLAQVNASGQVTSWDPGINGPVYSMLLSGSTLYVGGNFTNIRTAARNYLAAISTSSGNATNWNPGTNKTVYSMALGAGNTLYLGGDFTKVAGQTRNRLAAVDAATGALIAGFDPDAGATVMSVAYSGSQNLLYVGGVFTSIGGQTRQFLGALQTSNGAPTSWNPVPSNVVYSLMLQGSSLYAGGDFSYIYSASAQRNYLASFDLNTGDLNTGFDAGLEFNGQGIRSLAFAGGTLYASGQLYGAAAGFVSGAVAVNPASGAVNSWRANCNGKVNTIAVSGSHVYLGGAYNIFAGSRRDYAAGISTSTGQLTAWNPSPAGYINTIATPSPTSSSQTTMYLGGYFFGIGSEPGRYHLAAVNTTTGAVTAWAPQPNYEVKCLTVSGNSVLAGGGFTVIGANGANRNYMASLSTGSGNASSWNPNPNGVIYAMHTSGTSMYLGGDFTAVGSTARAHIVAYSVSNPSSPSLITGFNPVFDGIVNSITTDGTSLYASGYFNNVNSTQRYYLAAVSTTNGSLLPWYPNPDNYSNTISALGGQVFIGGYFTFMNSLQRNNALAIDLTTGNLTAWNPDITGGSVYKMAIHGSNMFLGGYFTTIGGQPRSRLASVSLSTGAVSSWMPAPDNYVFDLAVHNNILYAGGGFTNIGASPRTYIAAFDNLGTTPTLTSFMDQGNTNGQILTVEPLGDRLYLGGYFNMLGGQARNYIGCVDISTGTVNAWNPDCDNIVNTISARGNAVYVGGYFANIGGGARPYLASLDASLNSSNLLPWAPNPDYYITHVRAHATGIAVSGPYIKIGGMIADNIVRLDMNNGKADGGWKIKPNGEVSAIALAPNQGQVYFSGNFTFVNDVTPRNGIASASMAAPATLSSWDPSNNGTVYTMLYRQDTMFLGGSFTTFNGTTRGRLAAIRTATNANISGNPNLDGTVYDLALYNGFLFATGTFSMSGASARIGLARFNAQGLGLTSWINDLDYAAGSSVNVSNDRLYVGGAFNTVSGVSRSRLAGIDLITNSITDINPSIDGYIYDLMNYNDGLYVAGDFYQAGGYYNYGLGYLDNVSGLSKTWDTWNGVVPVGYTQFKTIAAAGGRIFTGGNFLNLRGLNRNYFAAFVQPSVSVSGINAEYCAGDTANISANVAGTFDVGNIFTVELSDASGDFSSPVILATAAGLGNTAILSPIPASTSQGSGYRLRINASSPYIQGNATGNITIKPLPAAATAVVSPAGPVGICQGDSVQLSIPANAGHSWQWRNTSGNIAGAQSNAFQAKLANSYTVKVTNGFGCSIISAPPVTVNVNPLPTATISPNTTQSICSGQTVTFHAGTGAGLTYQWLNNNSPIAAATNSSYLVSLAGSYSVVVMNANSCKDTSAEIAVIIGSCGASIVSLDPPLNLCKGGSVDIQFNAGGTYNAGNVFTAQLSSSSGSFNNPVVIGSLTSINSGTINATIPTGQSVGSAYRIRIVSSNPASTGANNGTNLSVLAQPTGAEATITNTGSLTFCQGGSVTLSVPATAGYTYQWRLGGNAIGGATNNSHIATTAGVYSATVSNAGGCSRLSSNKTVNVTAGPLATVTPNTSQTICAGQTIPLQANTGSGLTWQWKNNNNNIAGATMSSYTVTIVGSYTVTVTNSSGCQATSNAVSVAAGNCGAVITDAGTRKLCQGGNVQVGFTATGFSAGNIFTLQLSDAVGSFASSQNIGTLTATAGGTISGTIPVAVPVGSGYKLRINSSNPATTGATGSITLQVQSAITETIGLCAVTVDNTTGKNMLIWNKPVTTNIDTFVIYRNTTSAGMYQRIGAQSYITLSKYTDNGSEPGKKAQRYYITGKNSCGETSVTDLHRTMHLSISQGQSASTWNLIWNEYEGFAHTRYAIYRGTSPGAMSVLEEIDANEFNSYTDFNAPAGTVYYMVAVADGPSCNPTARTTESPVIGSNIATNATGMPGASWMDMTIWPNPGNHFAQVLLQGDRKDAEYYVRITDLLGRRMEEFKVTGSNTARFGETLAPGIYNVAAWDDQGHRAVRQWIKQ
jgi:hypothetical protein